RDAPQRMTIDAQAVFLNQLAIARHRPDFARSVLPPSVRAGISRFNTAVAERLDAVANPGDGTAGAPRPGLRGPLAELTEVVEPVVADAGRSAVAAELRARLALYRLLVPRIERLAAAARVVGPQRRADR